MVCALGEHQHLAPLPVLRNDGCGDHLHACRDLREMPEHCLVRRFSRDVHRCGEPLRERFQQLGGAGWQARRLPDRPAQYEHDGLRRTGVAVRPST
jgi:hypothetical protein